MTPQLYTVRWHSPSHYMHSLAAGGSILLVVEFSDNQAYNPLSLATDSSFLKDYTQD